MLAENLDESRRHVTSRHVTSPRHVTGMLNNNLDDPLCSFSCASWINRRKQLNLRQSRSPSLTSARSGLSHDSFKVKLKTFVGIHFSLSSTLSSSTATTTTTSTTTTITTSTLPYSSASFLTSTTLSHFTHRYNRRWLTVTLWPDWAIFENYRPHILFTKVTPRFGKFLGSF